MVKNYIIADSGATKCQWTIVQSNKKTTLTSLGISPYFLSAAQIQTLIEKTFKNKISTVLQDMYNSYINYLRLLPDPTIAKEKLKKYQGNNAKSYPLTDAQKKKINGLAQSL